jgi:hypothetical protein
MKPWTLAVACFAFGAAFISGTAWGTTGTILFPPEGYQTPACSFSNPNYPYYGNLAPMYQPLTTSNSYAISSAQVYLIFVGGTGVWTDSNTQPLRTAANTIINSGYLSTLKQYGSDGVATYKGYWIDPANRPPSGTVACYPNYPNGCTNNQCTDPFGSAGCSSNNAAFQEAKLAITAN